MLIGRVVIKYKYLNINPEQVYTLNLAKLDPIVLITRVLLCESKSDTLDKIWKSPHHHQTNA